MILSTTFGILALLSAVIGIWQIFVGLRFPLHQRLAPTRATPAQGVTILKPIKGCDLETEACLRSWFELTHPGELQILIGVFALSDPAATLVKRLLDEYPMIEAELVHCPEIVGTNAKVSTLAQLGEKARHPFWCISDADVWAPPDFLEQSLELMAEPSIGLVNGFYHFTNAQTFGMRWEAFAVNADFWSQVLQSASMKPVDFALGAAMVLKVEALRNMGGFRAIANHLADDYHLGHRLSGNGWAVRLSPMVVECRSGPLTFASVWQHQLRWARTIRFCQPWPYFLSVLSNATLWPCLFWATTGSEASAITGMACLGLRSVQGLLLERRLAKRWFASSLWMGWMKDLLQVVIWALAFAGRRVSWRGVTYTVGAEGTLLPESSEKPSTDGTYSGGDFDGRMRENSTTRGPFEVEQLK